jgi:hypothetical protein
MNRKGAKKVLQGLLAFDQEKGSERETPGTFQV